MEGPSIFLAAEQLMPFVGKKILSLSGNTKIGKERLLNEKILAIFPYKKYLFFQFKEFALRTHFLMYGSFEATINGIMVTGEHRKKIRAPRLALQFKNGHLELYNCSVHFIESSNAAKLCDFTMDIMSKTWDDRLTYTRVKKYRLEEIADVLLDQEIFGGVGNIIKNEVLLKAHVSPERAIGSISAMKLKEIIDICREYVFNFYEWRKKFELKNHYQVYRQSFCKQCGNKVIRKKTGLRGRISFICTHCQI